MRSPGWRGICSKLQLETVCSLAIVWCAHWSNFPGWYDPARASHSSVVPSSWFSDSLIEMWSWGGGQRRRGQVCLFEGKTNSRDLSRTLFDPPTVGNRASSSFVGTIERNNCLGCPSKTPTNLCIGAALARFQTLRLRKKFDNLGSGVLSYEPWQFPAQDFVLNDGQGCRHSSLMSFRSEN